jgi:hypothetical protein
MAKLPPLPDGVRRLTWMMSPRPRPRQRLPCRSCRVAKPPAQPYREGCVTSD